MLWPAFVAAVVIEAVLLDRLPVSGDDGPGLFAAVLLAGFANLVVVAVAAPLAGRWLRRRRPGMPPVIATDRAGAVLVAAGGALVVALGLLHHSSVQAARADLSAQATSARRFVISQAPREFQANVDHLDTVKQGDHLYRTCVAGHDPHRAFCVFVNTDQSPPGVTYDPDQRPNADVARSGRYESSARALAVLRWRLQHHRGEANPGRRRRGRSSTVGRARRMRRRVAPGQSQRGADEALAPATPREHAGARSGPATGAPARLLPSVMLFSAARRRNAPRRPGDYAA